jgi:hypothetical protein
VVFTLKKADIDGVFHFYAAHHGHCPDVLRQVLIFSGSLRLFLKKSWIDSNERPNYPSSPQAALRLFFIRG